MAKPIMTKHFLKFKQYLVNSDGKKTNVGQIGICPESIEAVINLWDKSEFIIQGVVGIRFKNGNMTVIDGTVESVIQDIEEALL